MEAKCLIIDDDDLDRIMIQSFVKRVPQFTLAGSFASAEEAESTLKDSAIDIMFLDIDMPGISGLDLRRRFPDIPVCIFVTSHPEHAVESFETSAFDFLVKPVKYDRFLSAANRAISYLELLHRAALVESVTGNGTVLIREGKYDLKIPVSEIMYLEALGNYTRIELTDTTHHILSSIGSVLKEEDFASFVRIHRSYAVQKHFVARFNSREVELSNKALIPVGRAYKKSIDSFR
ncbi:LytR/AlgR family response regulator transcription factor [Flavobacterium silvaticum]|uniref:Response regulator transcription factor n=1 Tax=Flavobacterium silvaticum TaxID=1852020 RepID=A0A972G2D2_9FLAO|nr:LytTR family DNA-binding domain-containing protein [Flavobacterium silvaticum]NMH29196.1 response regulator transcription factor [Flavobacterium silvaticum]